MQANGEGGAFPWGTFDADVRAVCLDNLVGNSQTKPRARASQVCWSERFSRRQDGVGMRLIRAVKALKQARQVSGSDAYAGIRDGNTSVAFFLGAGDGDAAGRPVILDGIIKQDEPEPPQLICVSLHPAYLG